MLDEILEERVGSRRGRRVPRGVKRKMSGYKLRSRTPQPTVRIDFAATIKIVNLDFPFDLDRGGQSAAPLA